MKLWQSIHQSTQGRIVFAGLLLYAVWQMYLGGSAPGKVAESLREGKGKVNVQVVLPFTPDRFHVIAMQQFGRVSGTEDTSIEVRGVKRDDLSGLARPFWVKSIEPLKETEHVIEKTDVVPVPVGTGTHSVARLSQDESRHGGRH